MELVVGQVGRAHGVSGEVAVAVRTDDPGARFAAGAVLATDPPERGPLRVVGSRWHSGRLLVRLDGVTDRTAAERLRGTTLLVDSGALPPLSDPDEFYDHQLIGLHAVLPDGRPVGSVTDVLHTPGSDLLALDTGGEEEALVPFVQAIVPTVDLAAGRIVIVPPEGLIEGPV